MLKTSHMFNLLDARGAISVTERTGYIARVRNLARKVAESYVAELAPAEGEADAVTPEAAAGAPPASEALVVDTSWISAHDKGGHDFLLEIGVEEMPASACRAAIDLLPERVAGLFTAEGVEIAADKVHVMVSPRRIAVLIKDVPGVQALREIAQRGPAVEAAFDADGNPTKACEGFARAKGITAKDLVVREEGGRSFVYYVTQSESRPDRGPAARDLPEDSARHVLSQEHALGRAGGALLAAHTLAGGAVGRDGDTVRHRRSYLGAREPGTPVVGQAHRDQAAV